MRLFFVFVFSKRIIPYILAIMLCMYGYICRYGVQIHNNTNLTNDSKLRGIDVRMYDTNSYKKKQSTFFVADTVECV